MSFTERGIKSAAKTTDRELRDARYPGVRLRWRADRERATWYVIAQGVWHKVGVWPLLGCSWLKNDLARIQMELNTSSSKPAPLTGELDTIAQLMAWYVPYVQRQKSLSASYKRNTASYAQQSIIPLLGDMRIDDLDRSVLFDEYLDVLQERYAPATVQQHW
ncbi:MAG: hypothetical protein OIF34_04935, partial [Porticoccaceae bacterium]|nr:hypothetical protein [Porticoccaceae bacterium]